MRTDERMGTTGGAAAAAVPCAVFYLEVRWEDWENLTLPPRLLLLELTPPPLTAERPPEPEPNPPLPPFALIPSSVHSIDRFPSLISTVTASIPS